MCDIVKIPCAVSYCDIMIEMHLGHGTGHHDTKTVPRNAVLVYCPLHSVMKRTNKMIIHHDDNFTQSIVCGVKLLTPFARKLGKFVHPNGGIKKALTYRSGGIVDYGNVLETIRIWAEISSKDISKILKE